MPVENKLTSDQCNLIAGKIIDRFYRMADGGTEFGCDWPTMRVMHPTLCRVYNRLKIRYFAVKQDGVKI